MSIIYSYLFALLILLLGIGIGTYDMAHPYLTTKELITDIFNGELVKWWLTK